MNIDGRGHSSCCVCAVIELELGWNDDLLAGKHSSAIPAFWGPPLRRHRVQVLTRTVVPPTTMTSTSSLAGTNPTGAPLVGKRCSQARGFHLRNISQCVLCCSMMIHFHYVILGPHVVVLCQAQGLVRCFRRSCPRSGMTCQCSSLQARPCRAYTSLLPNERPGHIVPDTHMFILISDRCIWSRHFTSRCCMPIFSLTGISVSNSGSDGGMVRLAASSSTASNAAE